MVPDSCEGSGFGQCRKAGECSDFLAWFKTGVVRLTLRTGGEPGTECHIRMSQEWAENGLFWEVFLGHLAQPGGDPQRGPLSNVRARAAEGYGARFRDVKAICRRRFVLTTSPLWGEVGRRPGHRCDRRRSVRGNRCGRLPAPSLL